MSGLRSGLSVNRFRFIEFFNNKFFESLNFGRKEMLQKKSAEDF